MVDPDDRFEDERLRAIGRLVADFAVLEDSELKMVLRVLLMRRGVRDSGQTASAIADELPLRARLKLIESLFHLVFPSESSKPLDALRKRVLVLDEARSYVARSVSAEMDETVAALKAVVSAMPGATLAHATPAEINRLTEDVRAVRSDYRDFLNKLPRPLAAMPGTTQE